MGTITCLNCDTAYAGHYCPQCGQRATTRRFTLRRIFSEEFLSATLNLNQGLLRTLRDLPWRPGHLVRDYLGGRRKRYFNFIALLLILLGVEALIMAYARHSLADVVRDITAEQMRTYQPEVADGLTTADVRKALNQQKLSFLLGVPLGALVPWLVLRRLGYNFAEHCVVIVFLLALNTFLGLFIGLLGFFPLSFTTFRAIYQPLSIVIVFFDLLLYWQLTKGATYRPFGRLWRVVVSWGAVMLVIGMLLNFSIGAASGYRKAAAQAPPPVETLPPDLPPARE